MTVTLIFHFVIGGEEKQRVVNTNEENMDRVIGEVNDRLTACGATDIWHEEVDPE